MVSNAGFVISASAVNASARYFSMMIMLPGVNTAFTVGLTWAANAVPRLPVKRAALLALCNVCSNFEHIRSLLVPFIDGAAVLDCHGRQWGYGALVNNSCNGV